MRERWEGSGQGRVRGCITFELEEVEILMNDGDGRAHPVRLAYSDQKSWSRFARRPVPVQTALQLSLPRPIRKQDETFHWIE